MSFIEVSRGSFSRSLLALLLFAGGAASQSTVWVSGSGDDQNGDGSSGNPFRTISKAMNQANLPNSTIDTIKVLADTYDVTAGETFPIPDYKDGLDILGQETSPSNFPVIGGGVGDSSVRAFIEIIANSTNGHRQGILIQKVRFAGENVSGEDASSTVYVENANGYFADVQLDQCYVDRGAMNDASNADRASIVGVAGAASVVEDEPADGLSLVVSSSFVRATARGGVEVGLGADAAVATAFTNLEVRDCTMTLTGTQTAEFAVDYLLEGFVGTTGVVAAGTCNISGNVIDSRNCTSSGFSNGILIGADSRFGGSVSMSHSLTIVEDNQVFGCDVDGIRFFADQDSDSSVNIQSRYVNRNVCAQNGPHGLAVDFGDGFGGSSAGAYMQVKAFSCLLVGNGVSGFWVRNADVQTQGTSYLVGCTLAGNSGYGIQLESCDEPESLSGVISCIDYDNGLGSYTGWDPDSDPEEFGFNDIEGYFTSSSCTPDANGNVDIDPMFVNAASGNYRLASNSCLIDKGTTDPSAGGASGQFDYDFEGDPRFGDNQSDIGADETEY